MATAFDFDGGGHANACGCRIQPLSDDVEIEKRNVTSEDIERNIGAWMARWGRRSSE